MSKRMTVYVMLGERSRSLSGTFGRQEIISWFSRHCPEVPESGIGAHIQALTSNATNRDLNHPGLSSRVPLFDRFSHGLYRVHSGPGIATVPIAPTSASAPPLTPLTSPVTA